MRRLQVQLSSNEEIALRRIAMGLLCEAALRCRDVTRLRRLHLVEARCSRLGLTPLGRKRLETLPRAGGLRDDEGYRDFVAAINRSFDRPARRP